MKNIEIMDLGVNFRRLQGFFEISADKLASIQMLVVFL
jgi:hypothetical protein